MISFETQRLIIREPQISDWEFWFKIKTDESVMYYMDDLTLFSKDEAMTDLKRAIEDIANPERSMYFFVVVLKETGEAIGSVGYTVEQFLPVGKTVHMGYFMFTDYHSQGYMTEAVKRVMQFAFEENNVYRINTGCLVENRASEKVMIKSGMTKESFRKAFTWHDGEMKDRINYGILKCDYGKQNNYTTEFWKKIDNLIETSEIVIDRAKSSAHPDYAELIYPVDYGYLKDTASTDGGGIYIWSGNKDTNIVDAIICTVDSVKKDSEIKLLFNCTEEEKEIIMEFHNSNPYMKGVLVRR